MSQLILVDGVKWHDAYSNQSVQIRVRYLEALCPKHNLRLTPIHGTYGTTNKLNCAEDHVIEMPRTWDKERKYVVDRIDAVKYAQMPILNLDDEAVPVAKDELKNTDYWVRAKVTESKAGTRLIIWAGSKKDKNKTQLFIEPELKRVSFDQNDNHPTEVFAKVDAMFRDGVVTSVKKSG